MHCFPPEANALTWLERRGELVALKMQLCYMRSTAQHSTAQHRLFLFAMDKMHGMAWIV